MPSLLVAVSDSVFPNLDQARAVLSAIDAKLRPAAEPTSKADPWLLNNEGELLLGLKIEDSHALANAERATKVPGIAFAD